VTSCSGHSPTLSSISPIVCGRISTSATSLQASLHIRGASGALGSYHARPPTRLRSRSLRAACMPEPTESAPQPPVKPAARGLSNLTVRLLTAAVGIPIILWLLYLAPGWVFSCIAVLVGIVGGAELAD